VDSRRPMGRGGPIPGDPLHSDATAEAGESMHTTDDASQGAPAAPVRVLVIDDIRFAADALVEGLRHLGFDRPG